MQPEQRPSPPAVRPGFDVERDWFWTGVPAGFIVGVLSLLVWRLAGLIIGLVFLVLVDGAGAVWAGRDGAQCRTMFTLGSLLLLLPTFIVGFVIVRHVVSS